LKHDKRGGLFSATTRLIRGTLRLLPKWGSARRHRSQTKNFESIGPVIPDKEREALEKSPTRGKRKPHVLTEVDSRVGVNREAQGINVTDGRVFGRLGIGRKDMWGEGGVHPGLCGGQ